MSGETEQQPSAWTIDSVQQHLLSIMDERDRRYEQRFEAQEKAVGAALVSAEKAVSKSESASEVRFAAVNEFRQALTDQTAGFIPRTEYTAAHESLVERVNLNTTRLERQEGRTSGLSAGWIILAQMVSVGGAVVAIIVALAR